MLSIENLSVEYYRRGKTIPAVRTISLAIKPGEAMGLVGESGSGKSTVALAILRLIRPQEGRITSGTLIVFVLYLGRLYKPMKNLARMTDTLSKSIVAFERIRELLATKSVVVDEPGARQAPWFRGAVEFRDVRFAYVPGQPVLQGVTFSVAAGQRVAVVGTTGGGKSTLLSLLLRLYEPRDRHPALYTLTPRHWKSHG